MISIAIIDIIGLTYDGDTLNKRGLGGSESAVILLAREDLRERWDWMAWWFLWAIRGDGRRWSVVVGGGR